MTARSLSGLSSSWSRTFSTSYPSSWRSELRTTERSSACEATANTTSPTAAPIPTTASIPAPVTAASNMTNQTSDVDLDDGLHPDEAGDHEQQTADEHGLADRLVEQCVH